MILLGACAGYHIDGVIHARFGRQNGRQTVAGLLAQIGDSQPLRHHAVRRHDRRPAGVGHDGHTVALGQRRVAESHYHVDKTLDRRNADYAALTKHRVGSHLQTGERPGVRGCGSGAGFRSARLDRYDRFALGDALGQLGEFGRVVERLQVQSDHAGVFVVLPVLEQIDCGNICFVANAGKIRKTEVEFFRRQDDGHTQRPALRHKRQTAPLGHAGGKGRVHTHVGR